VSAPNKITAATDDIARLSGKDYKIIGKRVLTVRGAELGHAADVIFDEQTGRVTALALSDGNSASCSIVGIGSYAVVVVEPESEEGKP
jgi:sporulation protein YlmC with PRC-barrel domain